MDSESLKNVIVKLQKNDKFKANLVAIELFEAFNIYDPAQYISICLSALSSMINLELPHINVFLFIFWDSKFIWNRFCQRLI